MEIQLDSSQLTFDTYSEFLLRSTWGPAERFHNWNTRSILKEFIKVSRLNPSQTKIVEIGRVLDEVGCKHYKLDSLTI
jgi:hypothetical protein